MEYYYIVASVTTAQRGRELLIQAGIRARLQRVPAAVSKTGCAYAVTAETEPRYGAEILKRAGIPVRNCWLRERGIYHPVPAEKWQ